MQGDTKLPALTKLVVLQPVVTTAGETLSERHDKYSVEKSRLSAINVCKIVAATLGFPEPQRLCKLRFYTSLMVRSEPQAIRSHHKNKLEKNGTYHVLASFVQAHKDS
jgi:hypothetical protein